MNRFFSPSFSFELVFLASPIFQRVFLAARFFPRVILPVAAFFEYPPKDSGPPLLGSRVQTITGIGNLDQALAPGFGLRPTIRTIMPPTNIRPAKPSNH